MIRSARAFLLCLCFIGTCRATTFSTDISDLWSDPNEQGWGANVIQQGEILFITVFVYAPSGAPTWYVGSATAFTGQSGNVLNFSGPLYQTTGPWFGGAFNPANVVARQVGSISFSLNSVSAATIAYTADGTSVSKSVTRQTWRGNFVSGSYLGGAVGTYANCPGITGYVEEPGTISVAQTSSALTFSLAQFASSCTYRGPYRQSGRMTSFEGVFFCDSGFAGNFVANEIEASKSGFTANAVITSGTCTWNGRVGGVRRDQ